MFRNDKYVYGNQNMNVPAHLNFGKLMLDRLRLKNEEIALQNGETREKITYKELTQYAVNMAFALIKLGVKKGDVVAFGSEKRNEFIPTLLGVLFTGATYTPFDLPSGRATLKHKINLTKPTYFICSSLFWTTYSDILKELKFINVILTLDDNLESMNTISIKSLVTEDVDINEFEPAEVQGQTDTAFISYSSGTTGVPKGVEMTHLNCILNSLPDEFIDESLQTAFTFGEWDHNYDAFTAYKFLYMGRKIVYLEYGKPMFFKCVEECKINVAFVVPVFLHSLLKVNDAEKYNLNSLIFIYTGGSPMHSKTIYEIKRKFPHVKYLLQGYGMTETIEITAEYWCPKGPKPGSIGTASHSKIIKVVDPQTGEALGPNQRGEICVKGPSIMKGYIGIDPSTYLDKDGFFKSGDLGYYDDNKYFFIDGRLKEIIEYQGYKVAPMELETILQMHPGIQDVGVVGKSTANYGEEPTAFVVKQPGVDVTEQDLIEYVAAEVPSYMELSGGVQFIEKVPRNPRGKIMRHLLLPLLN